MRIGSGGVMLTHYSSYKVAEQFRMLHALFPDRIDLGLGRAPGSDQTTAAALAKGPGALSAEHYPAQVSELADFLVDEPNSAGAFRDVRATPTTTDAPPIWLLASSEGSAGIAAHLGMPLVWANFIAHDDGQPIVDAYRRQFQPSRHYPEPVVMLATAAICADTAAEAELLATSVQQWRARGLRGPIPVPGEPDPDASNPLRINHRAGRELLNGTGEYVREHLDALAERFGVDEVLVVTITHSHETRVRSYELLAEAYALTSTAG
jgi:luciferase family oxidoreductase group 1